MSQRGWAVHWALTLGIASSIASAAAPTIISQPTPQLAVLGDHASFIVIATGDAPLTYRWRKDGIDLVDGANVSGASTDALNLSPVSTSDEGDYSVVVADGGLDTTSADAALTTRLPRGGDRDLSFDPGSSLNQRVTALAVQPDQKILIGGNFSTVGGLARAGIARLRPDGSSDPTLGNGMRGAYTPGTDNNVDAIVVQPDGKVLIGGAFTSVNGTPCERVARLLPDGSLDPSFQCGAHAASRIVLQPDGRILVAAGTIARLNTNGSLDPSFQSSISNVSSMALQPDGRVVIGQLFPADVARLNPDGSLDASFSVTLTGFPPTSLQVYSVALQPDGKLLIGGHWQGFNGANQNGCLARVNPDGSTDSSFSYLAPNCTVRAMALRPDGKIVAGGNFTVSGIGATGSYLLASNGTPERFFPTYTALSPSTIAVQADGKTLLGGSFTYSSTIPHNYLVRLNLDFSVDSGFGNPPTGIDSNWVSDENARVWAVRRQPDGRVLIGGRFTRVGGVARNHLARLESNGSLDPVFLQGMAGPNDEILCIALQPDGKVLIGGRFTAVNDVPRNGLARLNPDGSLDTSFLNGANGNVTAIVLQPDGKILIPDRRLNPDGSIDSSFAATGVQNVYALALQPDGKVLIGGNFTAPRLRLFRANPDGSVDPTFDAGSAVTTGVSALAVQPDGFILAGGLQSWTIGAAGATTAAFLGRFGPSGAVDPTFANGFVQGHPVGSIALQPDGKIVVVGAFTAVHGQPRSRVARLNQNGSVDSDFLDGLTGADFRAFAVELLPDGRVLVGGAFGQVNGEASNGVVLLYGSTPVAPAIATSPSNQATYEGCCAVFHIQATGTPRNYGWRKGGILLADGPGVQGSASDTLILTGVTDEDSYSVEVSNVLGEVLSDSADLALLPVPICSVASCAGALGCQLAAASDGSSCDDGDACTTADSCADGVCGGTPAAPAEVDNGVRLSQSGSDTWVQWNPAPGSTSSALLRGVVSALPVGPGGGDESCLVSDLPVGTSAWPDAQHPVVGSAYWYLVRGDNACGEGSYGFRGTDGSPSTPRLSTTCP